VTPSYTVPAQPTGSRLGNIVGDLVDLLMHRTPLEFREVEPAWRALVEQHGAEFDAALVRYSHLLPLVAGLPQRRVVVDADDLRFLLLARRGRSHGFVTRVSHLLEAGRSWAHEQRLFRRVAHVITCSADDRALVRSARASVLPNGVAVEAVADAPRAAATLVFVGQCDWRPNRRGVAWFLREVWPLVRAAHPAARFQVVGQRAARTTFGVEELEGVSYHADVPSVAPWFAGASASIVPLWEGGGTRIKVIESLAYGTPVVATSLGAAGLRSRFTPALGLELADAPAAMAARIADLFADPGAALARAAAGQAVVLREFSWASILARLPDDLPRWVGDG
jgi:glycosyltransferase involved in cell wall biosynthesis